MSLTLKAVVLTLALVAVTGARAEVNADQVATVVWDYFRQLGNNAKEAVENLQKSELPQQLNSLFQDRVDGNAYTDKLKEKVVPFATSLHERLTEDSVQLKEVLQNELKVLGERLQPQAQQVSLVIDQSAKGLQENLKPYADELRTQVRSQTEKLRSQLSPYAEQMKTALSNQKDNLQVLLEPMAKELQDLIDKNVQELKGHLMPYPEHLQEQIDQHVKELSQILEPFAQDSQDKLNHTLEVLALGMKKNVDAMKKKLSADTDQLGQSLRGKLAGGAAGLQESLTQFPHRLNKLVEQFRSGVEPHGHNFREILVQQVKELKKKLNSPPGDVEDHLIILETNLRDKMNSFFSSLQKEGQDQPLQEGQDQPLQEGQDQPLQEGQDQPLQEGQDQPLAAPLPEQTPEQAPLGG